MEDHDAFALGGGFRRADDEFDCTGDSPAVRFGHFKRIFGHQLHGVDAGVFEPEQSEHLLDDRSPVGQGACVFVVGLFNGAAGRNERDLLHREKIMPRCADVPADGQGDFDVTGDAERGRLVT